MPGEDVPLDARTARCTAPLGCSSFARRADNTSETCTVNRIRVRTHRVGWSVRRNEQTLCA